MFSWGSTFFVSLLLRFYCLIEKCIFSSLSFHLYEFLEIVYSSHHIYFQFCLDEFHLYVYLIHQKHKSYRGVLITIYFSLFCTKHFIFSFSYKHFKSGSDKIIVVSSANGRISQSLVFPISLVWNLGAHHIVCPIDRTWYMHTQQIVFYSTNNYETKH